MWDWQGEYEIETLWLRLLELLTCSCGAIILCSVSRNDVFFNNHKVFPPVSKLIVHFWVVGFPSAMDSCLTGNLECLIGLRVFAQGMFLSWLHLFGLWQFPAQRKIRPTSVNLGFLAPPWDHVKPIHVVMLLPCVYDGYHCPQHHRVNSVLLPPAVH